MKLLLFSRSTINTDWFDATRNSEYTQNNISVSGSSENIKYFSLGNYEEKAVLNGLDFNRTTFRNIIIISSK
jgi:hypothetical protein